MIRLMIFLLLSAASFADQGPVEFRAPNGKPSRSAMIIDRLGYLSMPPTSPTTPSTSFISVYVDSISNELSVMHSDGTTASLEALTPGPPGPQGPSAPTTVTSVQIIEFSPEPDPIPGVSIIYMDEDSEKLTIVHGSGNTVTLEVDPPTMQSTYANSGPIAVIQLSINGSIELRDSDGGSMLKIDDSSDGGDRRVYIGGSTGDTRLAFGGFGGYIESHLNDGLRLRVRSDDGGPDPAITLDHTNGAVQFDGTISIPDTASGPSTVLVTWESGYYSAHADAADVTYNLPDCSGLGARAYHEYNFVLTSGPFNMNIVPDGTDLINGVNAPLVVSTTYTPVRLRCSRFGSPSQFGWIKWN